MPALGADALKALDRPLEKFSVSAPLDEAVKNVGELGGVTIRPDWEVLESTGVPKDTRVVLRTGETTVRKVLDLVLVQVAAEGYPLAWYVDDNVVRVTTQTRVLYRNRDVRAGGSKVRSRDETRNRRTRPRRVKGLDFEQIELEDAIDFFRAVSGVNFYVNWKSLELVGVGKDTPITIKADNISVGRALDLVTDQLSAGRDTLQRVYWVIDDGVVTIATGEALNRELKTRVFDVADLMLIVPDFKGPRLNLPAGGAAGDDDDDDDDGDGGLGGLWGDDDDDDDDGENVAEQRRRVRENLVGAIKDSIGEEMWQPVGKGSIRLLGDRLIISQTRLGFKLLSEAGRTR